MFALLGTLPGIAYGYLAYSYFEGQIAPAVITACLGAFIGCGLSFRAVSGRRVARGVAAYLLHRRVIYLPDTGDKVPRRGDLVPPDADMTAESNDPAFDACCDDFDAGPSD